MEEAKESSGSAVDHAARSRSAASFKTCREIWPKLCNNNIHHFEKAGRLKSITSFLLGLVLVRNLSKYTSACHRQGKEPDGSRVGISKMAMPTLDYNRKMFAICNYSGFDLVGLMLVFVL